MSTEQSFQCSSSFHACARKRILRCRGKGSAPRSQNPEIIIKLRAFASFRSTSAPVLFCSSSRPGDRLLGMSPVFPPRRASRPCRLSPNSVQDRWSAVFENLPFRHSPWFGLHLLSQFMSPGALPIAPSCNHIVEKNPLDLIYTFEPLNIGLFLLSSWNSTSSHTLSPT